LICAKRQLISFRYEASERCSYIDTIGDIYVAVSYNKVLSALKDIWAHVGSVADGGGGKKRELGCNNPHVDHEASFAFCQGIVSEISQAPDKAPAL